MSDQVVLLDEDGTPTGVADRATVHGRSTPLHLAFSCHLFDDRGRVLVTRRSLVKPAWPGVWTNSVCGHPEPGEAFDAAVRRRAGAELGVDVDDVRMELRDFRYRAVDPAGVVEYEICPVLTAVALGPVRPDPAEVMDLAWVTPDELATVVRTAPWSLSPWLVRHAPDLAFLSGTALA